VDRGQVIPILRMKHPSLKQLIIAILLDTTFGLLPHLFAHSKLALALEMFTIVTMALSKHTSRRSIALPSSIDTPIAPIFSFNHVSLFEGRDK
jgi:hypothetical protein